MDFHKFPIYLSSERIFSNSEKAINLQNKSKIGELKEGKVVYSGFEALYLYEAKKAQIINIRTNKPLTETKLMGILAKKSDFLTKYLVFKYLKNKGYIVKTGLKFGEEFRVYDKSNPSHAKWIVFPIKQSGKISPKELIAKSRVTHSTGKKLLLAIVDQEEDIIFYEVDWVKP